jgi:hypothetical protein
MPPAVRAKFSSVQTPTAVRAISSQSIMPLPQIFESVQDHCALIRQKWIGELLHRGEAVLSCLIHALAGRMLRFQTRRVQIYNKSAGIGSTCGLGGRKPDPGPPGVGSRCTTYMEIPPGGTPRLQWGSVVACCSTAVTAGFVRGHRTPVTTNNRRIH